MTLDLFTALLAFTFVSSITPGPNNLMLMASGANFGILRTIPHGLGVGLGFTFMIILIGLGLAQAFDQFPILHDILKFISVAYMLWLAWKIGTAAPKMNDPSQTGKPFTFFQAAAFQWVNPKAWAMALTAITLYTPDGSGFWGTLFVAAIFGAVNIPCISCWALLGVQMRQFLNTPTRLRAFNYTMAALLVISLYPILL